jgi:hypothetical protein
MSEKDHVGDLTSELKRREMAYKFMSLQLAQHIERGTRLEAALKTAMILIDHLFSDLHIAGGTPGPHLLAAHNHWNTTMRKLFEKQDENEGD